jgi:hypothetical protein
MSSKSGVVRITCPAGRAQYLIKWATYLKTESAMESIEIYPPDHQLYARGLYWNISVTIGTEGKRANLFFIRRKEVDLTHTHILLEAAFRNKNFKVKLPSEEAAHRYANVLLVTRTKLYTRWKKEELRHVSITRDKIRVHVAAANATPLVEDIPIADAERIIQQLTGGY